MPVNGDTQRAEDLLVASAGKAGEFVAFYDRMMPGLLRFFARCTLDGQVAADLTAETLADAFAARHRFRDRGDGSARAWLYTIAHRKFARLAKRRRVETKARRRLGLDRIELAPDDIARVEALVDFEEVGRAVATAFRGLGPTQREALHQRVVEGRSYREIAADLGCSEDVVRARVCRGLRQLATQLDK